jgi:glycosyltransferase involved in cell wall biosynthesis
VDYQTYNNWEHIICSDGYEPSVEQLVQEFQTPKKHYLYLKNRTNNYGNSPRQFALQHARGDFLVFLDDDNLLYPHYLEKMFAALCNTPPDIGFSVCKILHLGPLPKSLGVPPKVLTGIPVKIKNIDTLQVMVKKKHLLSIGGWNENAGYLADGYTFQKLAEHFGYVTVDETLGVHT